MKLIQRFMLLTILLFSANMLANNEQGGQYKNLGPWQVHYIAFPSTFLQPSIAKNYGIERSNYNGVINISVLNNSDKQAQKVLISGSAKNLVGQNKPLKFQQIVDGDSIYYIAEVNYTHEEIYRFNIDIKAGKNSETLTFQQKFYVD